MNDFKAERGALEGVRILDFSRIWAGPHATKLLADMGAEVIKVEAIRAWDPHRMIVGSGNLPDGERGEDPWNRSGWFNTLHMSKLGITAEMRHPEGKAIIEDLVSISDVVIENFRAGLMERRGLGYEAMRAIRPDIIMLSMPAFGSSGPMEGLHSVRHRSGAARRHLLDERLSRRGCPGQVRRELRRPHKRRPRCGRSADRTLAAKAHRQRLLHRCVAA